MQVKPTPQQKGPAFAGLFIRLLQPNRVVELSEPVGDVGNAIACPTLVS